MKNYPVWGETRKEADTFVTQMGFWILMKRNGHSLWMHIKHWDCGKYDEFMKESEQRKAS